MTENHDEISLLVEVSSVPMRGEILDLEKGGLKAGDKIVGSGTGIYEVPRGEKEEKTSWSSGPGAGAARTHSAETCRDASAQPLPRRSKRQGDGSPVQGSALFMPDRLLHPWPSQ